MVIIPFFSKHLNFVFFFQQSLQILPLFKVREVSLSFHHLLPTVLDTGTFVFLQSPRTSHTLYNFPKSVTITLRSFLSVPLWDGHSVES